MNHLAIVLIVVGIGILVALVLRFVQPELIYSLRYALILIRMNKRILDRPQSSGSSRAFLQLILTDRRFETRVHDAKDVRGRVRTMRANGRALDSRSVPENISDYLSERICIMELADISKNLAGRLVPRKQYFGASVDAMALLRFIADRKREVLGWPPLRINKEPLQADKEVEHWFLSHPISMEQTVELLSAVVLALASRQQAETEDRPKGDDLEEEITGLEINLRALVSQKYKSLVMKEGNVHPPQKTIEKIYQEFERALGQEQCEEIKLRQRSSRNEGAIAVIFTDFMYVRELSQLMFAEWSLFARIFGSWEWMSTRLTTIIQARDEIAKSQTSNNGNKMQALAYCKEIQKKLDEYEGSDEMSLSATAG